MLQVFGFIRMAAAFSIRQERGNAKAYHYARRRGKKEVMPGHTIMPEGAARKR